jgi:raffinose/stachyose/melibiose transport system substrate-binding protein
MNPQKVVKLGVGVVAAVTLLAIAAIAAGANGSKRDTVTLLVWDQEVRGGQAQAVTALNKAFQKKYPNIKINRVAKSFTDLQATLKLAASGPNPPDVVEANNGYAAMGPLVQANLLLSLNKYAAKYGWSKRYSAGVLRMNKFTADAKNFGTGNLYGIPMTGEIVGVYYNKAKLKKLGLGVPKTFQAFEAAITKAKSAGETPIQFGNLDKWPGIHEFEEVWLQSVSIPYARNFIFGTGGGSTNFVSAGTTAAATKLASWAKDNAFTNGYAGLGYDASSAAFGKGTGVFMITGSWQTSTFGAALGKNVGFFLLPPLQGKAVATLGGEGLPWAISSKTKNPDAAATYLNFMTSNSSMQVVANSGQLTATRAHVKVPAGLATDVNNAYTLANKRDAIVPYLDWATPTMYDTVTAQVQELMAGKTSPSSFVQKIQSDYKSFHKS